MKKLSVKYSIIFSLIMIANFTSCGIKGNPVIISHIPDRRSIVQNIRAVSPDDAVILKRDYNDRDYKISHIAKEKSEDGSSNKDCQRTFQTIAHVSIKEIK